MFFIFVDKEEKWHNLHDHVVSFRGLGSLATCFEIFSSCSFTRDDVERSESYI